MSMLNIPLSDTLKNFVDQQVADHGFSTSAEYVRVLILKDQERSNLHALLMAGAASAQTPPVDQAYFKSLKDRIQQHAAGE